jgi:hypothetical protein
LRLSFIGSRISNEPTRQPIAVVMPTLSGNLKFISFSAHPPEFWLIPSRASVARLLSHSPSPPFSPVATGPVRARRGPASSRLRRDKPPRPTFSGNPTFSVSGRFRGQTLSFDVRSAESCRNQGTAGKTLHPRPYHTGTEVQE